jgi:FMN phosphatase YigB (HAD superfamily)
LSLTLLLDLDDTLLANSMDGFLPAYLQALSGHLSAYGEPARIISALMAGTHRMVQNSMADCSLSEVFDSVFYPMLGWEKADVQPAIDKFYMDVFPKLRQHTRPLPGGVELVEKAFERGYTVAIATNPLFPMTAIRQRLEWADLPVEKYPFHLVTSYESFHFAKPNPVFLAEVLARLGWPEGPVIMVGDDEKNDIQPARSLGLPTYWLTDEAAVVPSGENSSTRQGTLRTFLDWMDSKEQFAPEADFTSVEALLAILRSTPAALNSLCIALNEQTWSAHPVLNEWCPVEILCHLRDVEIEVNVPRLHKMLDEDNPFIPGLDTDRWANERLYHHQDGPRALHRFSAARQRALRLLDHLQPEDWNLPARHTIFGPTQLRELVGITAGHDRLHLRQLANTLKQIGGG